jgi:hypothetical protein
MRGVPTALLALTAAVISSGSAWATATFDFTQCTIAGQKENSACDSSSYSNNASSAFSQTINGITVTATALGTSGTSSSSDKNLNASVSVGQYAGNGLGVCGTGDTSCSDPQHQIDNNRSYQFILFKFSTAVDLSQITLANFGGINSSGNFTSTSGSGDMDFSYWTGVSTASTTISNLTSPGSGWSAQTNVSCAGTKEGNGCGTTVDGQVVTTDTLSGTGVTYLLIGAAYDGTSGCSWGAACGNTDGAADFFKIQSLSVTNGSQSSGQTVTPEPATFGLFGLALAGFGLVARRRSSV